MATNTPLPGPKPPNQKTTKGKTGKELEEATIAQERNRLT